MSRYAVLRRFTGASGVPSGAFERAISENQGLGCCPVRLKLNGSRRECRLVTRSVGFAVSARVCRWTQPAHPAPAAALGVDSRLENRREKSCRGDRPLARTTSPRREAVVSPSIRGNNKCRDSGSGGTGAGRAHGQPCKSSSQTARSPCPTHYDHRSGHVPTGVRGEQRQP